jgi:hypothetical protein
MEKIVMQLLSFAFALAPYCSDAGLQKYCSAHAVLLYAFVGLSWIGKHGAVDSSCDTKRKLDGRAGKATQLAVSTSLLLCLSVSSKLIHGPRSSAGHASQARRGLDQAFLGRAMACNVLASAR